MALIPILEVPDPRLREVALPVATIDDGVRGLLADMFETMYAARGIGLAATQLGIRQRVVVIDLQEDEDEEGQPQRRPQVFINPELVELSDERATYNEGCLSIPDQYGDVERPARALVRWQDGDGTAHEQWTEGLLSTCIQHEVDHLNGVLFIDHLSRLKRDMILKKLAKARKAA